MPAALAPPAEIIPLLLMPPENVETGPPDSVGPTKMPLPPTSIVALLLMPPPNVETLVTVMPAPLLLFVIVPELRMPPTMVAPFTRIPFFEERSTTPLLVNPPTSVALLLIRIPVAVALTVPVLMTLPPTLTFGVATLTAVKVLLGMIALPGVVVMSKV